MRRMKLSGAVVGAAMALAVSSGASFGSTYAFDDFVVGPTVPGKWGPPAFGTGASVTWSLMGGGLTTDLGAGTSFALSGFMPAGFKAPIVAAFAAWSAVADITFTEVVDPGVGFESPGAGASDIRITGHAFDGAGGVLAHAAFPPVNGVFAAGDIHFDIAESWKIGFGGPGFDIFQVAAHEIGHAIGLAHELGVLALMNPFYTEAFSGLLADDIAGAIAIYGPAVVIPLPAALPLFGTGLAVMGFVGWRRKRKVAA